MEWLNLLSRLISFNCCGLFDYISFIPINLLGYKKSFFNVMVWISFSYRVLIRKSAIRLINALVWNAVWITKTNFIKDFDKVFNISLFGPFLFQTQLFYLSFQSVQHGIHCNWILLRPFLIISSPAMVIKLRKNSRFNELIFMICYFL